MRTPEGGLGLDAPSECIGASSSSVRATHLLLDRHLLLDLLPSIELIQILPLLDLDSLPVQFLELIPRQKDDLVSVLVNLRNRVRLEVQRAQAVEGHQNWRYLRVEVTDHIVR